MNIGLHNVSNYSFCFLWEKYAEVELLDHRVSSSIFNVLRVSILFSIVAAPIYIPTNSAQGFSFSTSFPRLIIYCLLDDSHSDRCEMISL